MSTKPIFAEFAAAEFAEFCELPFTEFCPVKFRAACFIISSLPRTLSGATSPFLSLYRQRRPLHYSRPLCHLLHLLGTNCKKLQMHRILTAHSKFHHLRKGQNFFVVAPQLALLAEIREQPARVAIERVGLFMQRDTLRQAQIVGVVYRRIRHRKV